MFSVWSVDVYKRQKQNLIGLETIMRWHFLNHFTMNATYSYVNVSKTDAVSYTHLDVYKRQGEHTVSYAGRNLLLVDIVWENQGLLKLSVRELATQVLSLIHI